MKISTIYLDIDIKFEKFMDSDEKEAICSIARQINTKYLAVRMSSGGNTHVKVVLNAAVTVLRYFSLRAAMGDDAQHLACDLTRVYRFGEDTARQNLTADKKIKQGRLLTAGDWFRIS